MPKKKLTEHKEKYLQYLRSKEWKAIRLDIIQLRGCCERCGSTKRLEVHHITYKRLFNENPEDLELLCSVCHRKEHKIPVKKKKKRNNKRGTKRKPRKKLHDYSISDVTIVKKKGKNYKHIKMKPSERQRILDMLNNKAKPS